MVGEFSAYESEDEVDNLSALAFYQPAVPDDESDLAALDAFVAYAAADDDTVEPEPLFTVTNPPGTVTVTTYLDGRVQRIELSPRAAHMSERELAEEVVVIAGLATQDARSAQYSSMLDGMREHGHDDPATRDFLQRDLGLPTPEEARARRAEVFATRYAGSHE
ncbi:hypothetical protein NIIDNTM18_00600 [Mycolicibacterium litorale]|uniref:Secretion protein EspD n=1 Tax=Mycolicibacterium litorale TaxID=758802 RepID=A0A6S6NYC8_9MYCO|nr:YbaB/EbfC family DNA-binding protein [Mycolicibacterium litorale]BCI50782.1 hypothetical protein NIIDNTM18_00600 [Mycolicibacterium litorale]